MLLSLLLNPVSASKKLINKLTDNILIGLSIGLLIFIPLLPAIFIMESVHSIVSPLLSVGGLLNSNIAGSNLSSNIDGLILRFVFQKLLIISLIVSAVIFFGILAYYSVRKIKTSPKYIWQSITVSSIQILYYILIAGLLSFISVKLGVIVLIGIINSVISLYSLLVAADITQTSASFEEKAADANISSQQQITETKEQIASVIDTSISNTSEQGYSEINSAIPVENDNILHQKYSGEIKKDTTISEKIKNLSKKQKTGLITLLAFAVILILLFCAGNAITSRSAVCDKFTQAIKNNDAKELSKYIVCSDSRVKINQNSLAPYLKYLQDNPKYTSALLSEISSQSSSSSDTLSGTITLTTKGNKFLFFKNYVFQLPACFAKIQTDYKNTVVSLNNENLFTADSNDFSKECGPFLPGEYTFNAKLKTDYAETKGHEKVTFYPGYTANNTQDVKIPLDGKKLYLYTEYNDANIIVNGKDTGITVKNIDSLMPLPADGKTRIKLQYKFPWGTLNSSEATVGNDSSNLSFDKGNSALLDLIKPAIVEFTNSYINAYKALDVNKFTNISDNNKNSLTNDINNAKTGNTPFSGTLTSVTADLSSMDLSSYDNQYSVCLNISLNGDFSSNGQPVFKDKSYSLKLIYDNSSSKWLVDGLYSSWYSSNIENGTEIKLAN